MLLEINQSEMGGKTKMHRIKKKMHRMEGLKCKFGISNSKNYIIIDSCEIINLAIPQTDLLVVTSKNK